MSLPPIPPETEPAGTAATRAASEIRKRISKGQEISEEQEQYLAEFEQLHPPGGPRSFAARQVRHTEISEVRGQQGPTTTPAIEREAGRRIDNLLREAAEDRRVSRELMLAAQRMMSDAFSFSMQLNESLQGGMQRFMDWHEAGWAKVNESQAQAAKAMIGQARLEIAHQREVAEIMQSSEPPLGIPRDVWDSAMEQARKAIPELGPALPSVAQYIAKMLMDKIGSVVSKPAVATPT